MSHSKMRKRSFLALVLLTVVSLSSAYASKISFRFYGGLGYVSGNDLNDGLKGLNDYYAKYFWYFGVTRAGGDYVPVHLGVNFGGDVIIPITPVIGIGFGAGYLQGKSDSSVTFTPIAAHDETTAEVRAVPLRLGFYFSLPSRSVVNLNFHLGLDYYLAKMSYDFRTSVPGSWARTSVQADGNGLGFQGGLGLEFRFSSAFSFFLEGQGRYARIGGFEGSGEKTDSYGDHALVNGKVYYYQTRSAVLGNFSDIYVHTVEPSGSTISHVKEAKIDFSGFSFLAGIILHF